SNPHNCLRRHSPANELSGTGGVGPPRAAAHPVRQTLRPALKNGKRKPHRPDTSPSPPLGEGESSSRLLQRRQGPGGGRPHGLLAVFRQRRQDRKTLRATVVQFR